MIWKDVYTPQEEWCYLRVETSVSTAKRFFWVESGNNARFKLYNGDTPLLWGTICKGYYGCWVLHNDAEWALEDMPIKPIRSDVLNTAENQDFFPFWSRYFAKELNNPEHPFFTEGIWQLYRGFKSETERNKYKEVKNPEVLVNQISYIDWGLSGNGNVLIPLKMFPDTESGRVKWYRKLVRAGICPPILVLYLNCLDGFVVLDGHCRLAAFNAEGKTPQIISLYNIREQEIITDENVQQNILKSIEARNHNPQKKPLATEQINALLISVFDNTPFNQAFTRSVARHNYAAIWEAEVIAQGAVLHIDPLKINNMINREEE